MSLRREDCYCDLTTFYENVARRLRKKVTDKTKFDCRKICVTKSVQEVLWSYYREEKNRTDEQIAAMLLGYGLKPIWKNMGFWSTVQKRKPVLYLTRRDKRGRTITKIGERVG